MVIFFIAASLFVLIILILQCRITIGFTFIMDNLVSSAYVKIYFFGIDIKKIIIYPRNKKKKASKKKVNKKRDLKQIRISFYVLYKIFKNSLIFKDFKLFIKEGIGDACYTALLYGVLWELVGATSTVFFNKFNVKNKKVEIETDFKEKVWKLNLDCIFSLKIVNIIFMCLELIKIYLKNRKGGDGDVKSSNRRSNDYSHAEY